MKRQDLEFSCAGGDMARHAASAFGNIEAAFYVHEIDPDTMKQIKNSVTSIIQSFDAHCKCKDR